MNNENFCYKLYDEIMAAYNDTSKYKITTDEYNSHRVKIECIPEGLDKSIDVTKNIKK